MNYMRMFKVLHLDTKYERSFSMKQFPEGCVWGAASASYQIEGGAYEDGKGLSIWDHFSHVPGKVFNGQTGDIACDAYHRFEEDLDLMQQFGIRNYRFSISWPRVFPDGTTNGAGTEVFPESCRNAGMSGSPDPSARSDSCQQNSSAGDPSGLNEDGIAYYDRIVDGCLSRGITPWITLYHWDLPLALYHKGGWANRETAEYFARYAAFIAGHFKGRVSHYITINEPQCIIGMGMESGLHAPGLHLDHKSLFLCWHNLLLAHGMAAKIIREIMPDAVIGVSSTGALAYTAETEGPTPDALVQASFKSLPLAENPGYYFNHQWFLDPVFLGHYPDDPENPWAPYAADVPASDLDIISGPVDFAGLNLYNGHELIRDNSGTYRTAEKYPGYPRTALKWPVTPEVFYWGPRLIFERYHKPVYITENGQSCNDRIFLDGKVHDPDRIDFLHRYLRELKKACVDDIPVHGYFHWSLTDNFEWHSGYDDRFGLIYIDYRDQRRIPKDSAAWYAEVIRTNGTLL